LINVIIWKGRLEDGRMNIKEYVRFLNQKLMKQLTMCLLKNDIYIIVENI
jgi:uncharacterized Fe-S cluster-containing protein